MQATAASCNPIRMPPPWLHPEQQNSGSESTLCGATRPPWLHSVSNDSSTEPQIDTLRMEVCPHGNGSQAMGLLQPMNGISPQISEKPSAASSESGSIHAPRESESDQPQPWWKTLVRDFTPSWYSITMGTGMAALVLHALPYQSETVTVLYTIIFIINVFLFLVITVLAILRYTLYPQTWGMMIRHPVQSLFLGCCPMGLTTLINMFIFVCIENAGWTSPWAAKLAWGLWWVDVVMAVACSLGLPFLLMYVHQVDLPSMTAVWLLPASTPIVTASNGATVASILSNPQHALWTLLTSYVLWGIGLPMAVVTLVIYFHRLTMHKLPPREVMITVFMPVGPLGQASFTIMNLGKQAMELFPETGVLHPMAGDIFYIVGFAVAIVLWGFGLVWLFFAVASCTRSRFPFNMGWWGFTFPTGVYVLATLQMGVELPSAFFDIFGTVMAVIVVLIWFLVAVITLQRNLIGEINFAPCFLNSRRSRATNLEVADRV